MRRLLFLSLLFVATSSWGQFTGGMVRVEGTVEGCDNSFRTGELYLRNSLTGEDVPVTFLIDRKGSFNLEFPVQMSGMQAVNVEQQYRFYIEAGKTLRITFRRDGTMWFEGDLARENTEMQLFRRAYAKLEPEAVKRVFAENMAQLNALKEAGKISDDTYSLLNLQEQSMLVYDMLNIAFFHKLKHPNEPFPVEWYSFLRAIPLDDPRFIEIESHIVNTVQYIALADYGSLDTGGDPARLVREQIALFDSVYTAVTGRPAGLMSDLVALQQLRVGQLERQGNYSPEQLRAMHRVVCDNIESSLLKEEVWRHYDFMMGQNSGEPTSLPEGEATETLRKITDRFRGKSVLIDFWGTACGPCVKAIRDSRPERMRIEQEDKAEVVFITSRGFSPDAATYEKFVSENYLVNSFRVSNDEMNLISSLFGIVGIPRYVLLDAEGNVVNQNHNGDLKNL